MSDNAGGNADRDAFFDALGRVFQEYGDVSSGYAIYNHARVTELLGVDVQSRGEVRIGSGGTVTIDHGPGGDTLGAPGECVAVVFNPLKGRECIIFMAP